MRYRVPCLLLLLLGCDDAASNTLIPGAPRTGRDSGVVLRDAAPPGGGDATSDAAGPPADTGAAALDAVGPASDAAEPASDAAERASDAAGPASDADRPASDAAEPASDAAEPASDAAEPASDAAAIPPDAAPPPDPDVPPGRRRCSHGPGWTLLALHWGGGSSSARVDHWDADCDYSIRINDACGAFPRCGDAIANCNVAVVDGGDGLLLDGTDDLLLRFNASRLAFAGATLYFEARGTRGGGRLEIWSPIYGGLVGPIDGGAYQRYEVDWSDFLRPGDDPGLTGIRFDAVQSHVAIHAIEVCLHR